MASRAVAAVGTRGLRYREVTKSHGGVLKGRRDLLQVAGSNPNITVTDNQEIVFRLRVGMHQIAHLVVGTMDPIINNQFDINGRVHPDEPLDHRNHRIVRRSNGKDNLVERIVLFAEGGKVLETFRIHTL